MPPAVEVEMLPSAGVLPPTLTASGNAYDDTFGLVTTILDAASSLTDTPDLNGHRRRPLSRTTEPGIGLWRRD